MHSNLKQILRLGVLDAERIYCSQNEKMSFHTGGLGNATSYLTVAVYAPKKLPKDLHMVCLHEKTGVVCV